ncbi:MAG TPA: BA14K family protein [Xanthobacteraceae bacterium]|nr:BA14K family protein [Xanthobacteraceae bacterium]
MRIVGTAMAAALALSSIAVTMPAASAAPVLNGAQLSQAVPGMTEAVQWRRHYGPRYYGPRHRGGNAAAGVAAGLAAGAILGGVIASQAQPRYVRPDVLTPDDIAYCAQRFRSYDARTGTYLGHDGYRHPCP